MAVERIRRWCPRLLAIRVLSPDDALHQLYSINDSLEEIEVCIKPASGINLSYLINLKAHISGSQPTFNELDLLAISHAQTLTKISLTILEPGYSYTVIKAIAEGCSNLAVFHLHIWTEDVEDEECLGLKHDHCFTQLVDLKVTPQAVLSNC